MMNKYLHSITLSAGGICIFGYFLSSVENIQYLLCHVKSACYNKCNEDSHIPAKLNIFLDFVIGGREKQAVKYVYKKGFVSCCSEDRKKGENRRISRVEVR